MNNKENLYKEVGIILEMIQLWENEFKLLTQYFNIEKSDDKRSLSNMNNFLFRNKIINEEEFLVIKKVIEERNYIIHRLFLEEDITNIFEYITQINTTITQSLIIFKSKYKWKRAIICPFIILSFKIIE